MPRSFSVSVAGLAATHPLDLARQLSDRQLLAAYFTALPRSRTPGVRPDLVHRHLALLVPLHASMRGWLPIPQAMLYGFIDREFDRWVSRRVVPADVVHALAGIGRRQRLVARDRFGSLTVCDAPTTHVQFQKELLDEEHAKWGAAPIERDRQLLASVEEEYDECDLILVASRFALRSFAAKGFPDHKLAVAPYGVDPEAFRPVGKSDDVFRMLFVGNLSIRKGLPYLLEAVSKLRWPNAELALRGGDTPESRDLLSRYKGTIPIVTIPPQPKSMLKHVFSNASVLVLPSIEDGFGLVIGQALACGTPVIASTHTGGPDLIEEGVNGFIVPPGDARALEAALTAAYEDQERLRAMGVEARRRVEADRGWGRYGDQVVAAFEQALFRRDHYARRLQAG